MLGAGALLNSAHAGAGCPTGVIVLPSVNPTSPAVNANVCVNEAGHNAEVGVVPNVDTSNLFVGTQAQTICDYTFGRCVARNSGRVGVDVNLPTDPVRAGFSSTGPLCVGNPGTCPFAEVSGAGGSVTIETSGLGRPNTVVSLSPVCVRFNDSTC